MPDPVIRGPVTIEHVARRAGVSPSTASRALRNAPGVHARTRELVLRAARELGFAGPNWLARGLRTGESRVIAVEIESFTNSYYAELAEAIERKARHHGLLVVITTVPASEVDTAESSLRQLLRSGVAGLIHRPVTGWERRRRLLRELSACGLTVVIVGDDLTESDFPIVGVDTSQGVRLAIDHLYSLGHRAIGFLSPSDTCDRAVSYRASVRRYGLAERLYLVPSGIPVTEAAYQTALALLDAPDRPSAVLCFNDLIAVQMMQAARARGVRVPEDLSIVGFDDNAEARLLQPALTTVRIPKAEMGEKAVEIIIDAIARRLRGELSPEDKPVRVVYPTTLEVRGSTAPCAPAR
ncbi:MAG: LacI family DNA-binding transcriptional regulator [Limnochordales bacterium]|nr:LacI family DNA-binding transcriptional regulator [Limnochordales bacterium]